MSKSTVKKGKTLISSKTFWFNSLAVAIAIASLFGFGEFQADTKVTEIIGVITAIGNILLRLKTTQPITKLK